VSLQLILVALAVVAVPWLFAWRGGRRGAKVSAAVVFGLLVAMPALSGVWCWIEGCGQGIIVVGLMVPPVVVGCLLVAISGMLAAKIWPNGARSGASGRPDAD